MGRIRKSKAPLCVKCGKRPEIGPASHMCEPCCLNTIDTALGRQLEAWCEKADAFLADHASGAVMP